MDEIRIKVVELLDDVDFIIKIKEKYKQRIINLVLFNETNKIIDSYVCAVVLAIYDCYIEEMKF